eukprot:4977548-Pyramimonas_sp.AAC.2
MDFSVSSLSSCCCSRATLKEAKKLFNFSIFPRLLAIYRFGIVHPTSGGLASAFGVNVLGLIFCTRPDGTGASVLHCVQSDAGRAGIFSRWTNYWLARRGRTPLCPIRRRACGYILTMDKLLACQARA